MSTTFGAVFAGCCVFVVFLIANAWWHQNKDAVARERNRGELARIYEKQRRIFESDQNASGLAWVAQVQQDKINSGQRVGPRYYGRHDRGRPADDVADQPSG